MNMLAGFLSGFLGAMGFGGGSVLIIYLTTMTQISQLAAQGINLLFFIPCALVSICFSLKNRLIRHKISLYILAGALLGLPFGSIAITIINAELPGRLFGIFLIVSGIISLWSKRKPQNRTL